MCTPPFSGPQKLGLALKYARHTFEYPQMRIQNSSAAPKRVLQGRCTHAFMINLASVVMFDSSTLEVRCGMIRKNSAATTIHTETEKYELWKKTNNNKNEQRSNMACEMEMQKKCAGTFRLDGSV